MATVYFYHGYRVFKYSNKTKWRPQRCRRKSEIMALHLSANRKNRQGPGHPKYFKLEGSNPHVTFVQRFYTLPLSFGSQICLMWDIWRAYKIFMRLADSFLPIYWGAPLCC